MTVSPTLSSALTCVEGQGGHIGVCYVDLDGFKQLNDTHGHGAGDKLLVHVAQRLRAVIRDGDTAIRVGGDEFVVILDHLATSAEGADVVERIQ